MSLDSSFEIFQHTTTSLYFPMEVVGLIASAAQISVYACSIANLISELRQAARNGPLLLRERIQQLDVLGDAVERISLDHTLHTDVLSEYLLTIRDKISSLHKVVCGLGSSKRRTTANSSALSGAQRLRAALAFVSRGKEVEKRFVELQAHCQTLFFYMASQDRVSQALATTPVVQAPSSTSSIVKSQRFVGNTAGANSRQWLGNHANARDMVEDQVFEQNTVTENADQVFGSSVFPPDWRHPEERVGGEEKAAGERLSE
jgi:hypothetical protein